MKRLFQCEYCGRITRLTRSDKKTCSNSCAVKLLYARSHSYETPLDSYHKILNSIGFRQGLAEESYAMENQPFLVNKTAHMTIKNESSAKALFDATARMNELKQLKTSR